MAITDMVITDMVITDMAITEMVITEMVVRIGCDDRAQKGSGAEGDWGVY